MSVSGDVLRLSATVKSVLVSLAEFPFLSTADASVCWSRFGGCPAFCCCCFVVVVVLLLFFCCCCFVVVLLLLFFCCCFVVVVLLLLFFNAESGAECLTCT